MIEFTFDSYRVVCVDERHYKIGSADNHLVYKHVYGGKESNYGQACGVQVYKDEHLINSALILAKGGSTTVHNTGILLDGGNLIICWGNTVFCLTIASLDLLWSLEADWATCFQIFKIDAGYIVHGELYITKLDKDGNVIWQVGGSDIFVTQSGENNFHIDDTLITVTDWNNNIYKIGLDGQIVSEDIKM